MYIHDMTEVSYKNGYEAGAKKFYENVKSKLLEKGFYPAIVKNTLEEIKSLSTNDDLTKKINKCLDNLD